MSKVLSSAALWKEGGGYYAKKPEELRLQPLLPDMQRLRDRRIFDLFVHYGELSDASTVLEIGCGQSRWLPYLAEQIGCRVAGIDIESYAAELARANLAGAGHTGDIYCRDAFDLVQNADLFGQFDFIYSTGVMEHFDDASSRLAILAHYLKPGGRLLTTVPNLQGVNWYLQRLASLERLNMHVIYDAERLIAIHRQAGLDIRAAGYVGFHDGFVSATDVHTSAQRHFVHDRLCWLTSMAGAVWLKFGHERYTPESKWLAPHVYCMGVRAHDC